MAAAREEAVRLLRLLVDNYSSFFDSHGYLNSEGRKVLERAVRALLKEDRWLKGPVSRVRRRGSYEDVMKLFQLLQEASQGS